MVTPSCEAGLDSAPAQLLITRKRGELEWLLNPSNGTTERHRQSPFLKALAEARRIAVHEGWCYHHVQAILISIDQYAEAATGNREFFRNKPHSIGGGRRSDTFRD